MDFKFKNRFIIFLAFLVSAIQIILMKEIFQMGIASLFRDENSSFSFIFPTFSYYFEPLPNSSLPVLVLMYFTPYIYLILSIEVVSLILKKRPLVEWRFFIVIFILVQLGYLLIHIFYSAVILILRPAIENDWIALSLYQNFDQTERFVFAFGVIFLFVFYLNMSTKRIMKYFS